MIQKLLISILIILTIIIYCQYYCTYKPNFKITQTYLDKININVLQEKYPIVIYDQVIEPKELLKSLFAYSYSISKDIPILFNNKVFINLSKYLIIYNQISDVNIQVIHPRYRKMIKFFNNNNFITSIEDFDKLQQIEYVTIKLKKNQIIILPQFWLYTSDLPIQAIILQDTISYLINTIYKKLLI
jgi:hypothetical protein